VLLVTGGTLLQSKMGVLSLVSGSEPVLPSLIFSFWDWLFTALNLFDSQGPIFLNIIASERVFQTLFSTLFLVLCGKYLP